MSVIGILTEWKDSYGDSTSENIYGQSSSQMYTYTYTYNIGR